MHWIVSMLVMISSFHTFQSNAEGGPENDMSLGDDSEACSCGAFKAMDTKTHKISTFMIVCFVVDSATIVLNWYHVYKRVKKFRQSDRGLSSEQENNLQMRIDGMQTLKLDALGASLDSNDDSSSDVVANGSPTYIHKVTGETIDASTTEPQNVFKVYSVESQTRARAGIAAINDEIRRVEDKIRSNARLWKTVCGVLRAIFTPGTILANVSFILTIVGGIKKL